MVLTPLGHLWRALYPLALHLVGDGGAVQASSPNEAVEFRVIRELRPAAAGRFHDDMYIAIFCKGRQVDEIRHDKGPLNGVCGAAQKVAN